MRHILNIATITAVSPHIKMVTLDADDTIYEHGGEWRPRPPAVLCAPLWPALAVCALRVSRTHCASLLVTTQWCPVCFFVPVSPPPPRTL